MNHWCTKIWRIIFLIKEIWTRKMVKKRRGGREEWLIKLSTTDIAIN